MSVDPGSASLGVVAFELDAAGLQSRVLAHAVRIFSEPVLPAKNGGANQPKKAQRRSARSARRQFQRRAGRLRHVVQLAPLLGLDPTAVPPDSGQNIHRMRATAATAPIPLPDLLRVFLKLAKRRGRSEEFQERDEEETQTVRIGIQALHRAMTEQGSRTLGEYLAWRFDAGQTLKLKRDDLFADRALLEDEFERIWAVQCGGHACLAADDGTIKERFHRAIFFQRPLRSPAPMVGHCVLEPSLLRAPTAQPAAQAFRIEKQIADLRWGSGRRSAALTLEQGEIVRGLLRQRAKVTFEQIYDELAARGLPKPVGVWLNLHRANRADLVGDRTHAAMSRLGLLTDWAALAPGQQVTVINLLADIGSPEVLRLPGWHERVLGGSRKNPKPRRFAPEVIAFIDRIAAHPQFGRFSKLGLDSGRSAYSVKALARLAAAMQDGPCDEYAAIERVYGKTTSTAPRATLLPAPRETGNVVVDVALRQIWRTINRMIEDLGEPPAKMIVELGRDLALGLKRRAEIEQRISTATRQRRDARDAITALNEAPTRRNVLRYLLWTEQDQAWCPYCDRAISAEQALDGQSTHVEHILPRALTRIGQQRDHLVIAHVDCNYQKDDRTPFQAWGQDPERWMIVTRRSERFQQKRLFGKARQLLVEETPDGRIDDEVIAAFTARQFHETSWLSKELATWFRTICADVAVSRGTLTAHLRRTWGLDTLIPEARLEAGLTVRDKDGVLIDAEDFARYRRAWEGHRAGEQTDRLPDKRIDHRHHLIDALVIGLCDRSLYQRLARHYKQCSEAGETRLRLQVEPPIKGLRQIALDLVRNCNLSRKPDRHGGAPMFKGTAYSRSRDGQRLLVRKEVAEFGGTHPPTVAKVRADIDSIEHAATREIVRQAFEQRLALGRNAAEAISEPILHPQYGTRIRHVRVRPAKVRNAGAVEVVHGRRRPGLHKFLLADGYAYLELVPDAHEKVTARPVPHHLASATIEPGARRFFKGDTVRVGKAGGAYVVAQILAKNGGALVLAAITETTNVDDLKGEARKTVSGKNLQALEWISDV